jgi:DNA (cytosine-5)-methyltransferase 1
LYSLITPICVPDIHSAAVAVLMNPASTAKTLPPAASMICGSVFSGIGLLDYGLHLAGIQHAWFCEADEWRRGILPKRWPDARVHADVRHVGHGCEPVDLIAGGFPCKGASTAGKRNGFDHAETVLWREMARAVGELRPRYVLVENVANILALHDGAVWGEVLGDLAALGYDVVWDCLPAGAVGAPHLRDRVFAVASHAGVGRLRARHPPLGSHPRACA